MGNLGYILGYAIFGVLLTGTLFCYGIARLLNKIFSKKKKTKKDGR